MNGTSDNHDSLNNYHLRVIGRIIIETNVNLAPAAVPLLGTHSSGLA